MALELFKPFIYNKLEAQGLANTIKSVTLVEMQEPVVWDILEEVIREHPVLLNRCADLAPFGDSSVRAGIDRRESDSLHPLVLRRLTDTTWANGGSRSAQRQHSWLRVLRLKCISSTTR